MRRCMVFLATLTLAIPAFAGHPLSTDDTGTVAFGHLEIETAADLAESDAHEFCGGQCFTFGATPNVDFSVGLGFSRTKDSSSAASGMTDPEVGFKWRFIDRGEGRPSFALTGSVTTPSQSDVSSKSRDYGLTIISSVPAGANTFHFNLGRTLIGAAGENDVTSWGIAFEMPKDNGTAWYAEVAGDDSGTAGEKNPVECLIGWAKESRDGSVLSIGAAKGLTSSSPDMRIKFGITRGY